MWTAVTDRRKEGEHERTPRYDTERNLKLVTTPLVCLSDVSKQFDRIRALDHVSLAIPEGRIIGLLRTERERQDDDAQNPCGTIYGDEAVENRRPAARCKDKGKRRVSAGQQFTTPEKMLVSDIVEAL